MKLPYKVDDFRLMEKDNKYFIEEWDEDYHKGTPYISKVVEIDKFIYKFINFLYFNLIESKENALRESGKEEIIHFRKINKRIKLLKEQKELLNKFNKIEEELKGL